MHQRHHGLSKAIAENNLEAAAVCLDRHHKPPVSFEILDSGSSYKAMVDWDIPDARTRGAWANEIDATEAGAYACAIAATELSRGLLAVRRAETLKGADYYLAVPGHDSGDLEACLRLEVSGTSSASQRDVQYRLREKLSQAARGRSNLPALAAVVGFACQLVKVADVELT
jgi:hypothetical protein